MVREVLLVGVGMGNLSTLTIEARDAIARSGLLVGAQRMLEPFACREKRLVTLVAPKAIVKALREAPEPVASVLFSGDVGFYSGATALADYLGEYPQMHVKAIPGISSLSYFCARLLVPWQDARLVSAHGRAVDVVEAVRGSRKTFFLAGGVTKPQDICATLAQAGLGGAKVHVGERLSYSDERIVQGTAEELAQVAFGDLAVMLVVNESVSPQMAGELMFR